MGICVSISLCVGPCEQTITTSKGMPRKMLVATLNRQSLAWPILAMQPLLYSSSVRPRLHPAMTLAILASLKTMKTNRVALEWGCNPFWSNSIVFVVTKLFNIAVNDSDAKKSARCNRTVL